MNGHEQQLLVALLDAHEVVALRGNLSSHAVTAAAQGSGRYVQALSAALMTLGDKHGPIEEAHRFLKSPVIGTRKLEEYIGAGHKVPGWGSAFVKNEADPVFAEVEQLLEAHWPEVAQRLASVTAAFHAAGKRLYPNASAYTAAAALALGIPEQASAYLFVAGRLGAWSHIFNQNRKSL